MSMLLLVRNYTPAHEMIMRGDWQVSDVARNTYDLEGKVIGTLGKLYVAHSIMSFVSIAIFALQVRGGLATVFFNVWLPLTPKSSCTTTTPLSQRQPLKASTRVASTSLRYNLFFFPVQTSEIFPISRPTYRTSSRNATS